MNTTEYTDQFINEDNEEIFNTINEMRDLTEKTFNYYKKSLIKIAYMTNTNSQAKSSLRLMLLDADKVILYLKSKGIPYQHNLICIVIVCLTALQKIWVGKTDELSSSMNKLRDRQVRIKTLLMENKCSNKKSDKENENWCSYEDLVKCCKKRKLIVDKIWKNRETKPMTIEDLFEIQKWVLCGLYVGDRNNPPLRLDYINMIINHNDAFIDEDSLQAKNNLYIKSSRTKSFYLQEYKTVKKYGNKVIKLQPYLNKMINRWIEARRLYSEGKEDYVGGNSLLFNRALQPFTESTCCSYIKDAFSLTTKNITVNLIRHIYISDLTQEMSYEERKRISSLMCHNLDTQISYIKKDD